MRVGGRRGSSGPYHPTGVTSACAIRLHPTVRRHLRGTPLRETLTCLQPVCLWGTRRSAVLRPARRGRACERYSHSMVLGGLLDTS